MLTFDHLVIVCNQLDAGREFAETALGVPLQPGGKHAHFGTHNALLSLGPGAYLEVIAPDPEAPAPRHARWFGLDLPPSEPRLAHWVARSDALEHDLNSVYGGSVAPLSLERGSLRWRMGVPSDGTLPLNGVFPGLISWDSQQSAPDLLAPSGCQLKHLTVHCAETDQTGNKLNAMIDDGRVTVEFSASARLEALIETPGGEIVLQ